LGNYRQHVSLASSLGVAYAWAAYAAAGVHWVYGSVAALLASLGGLLPDLDCPSGVQLRGFTGILGVLAAVAVWQGLAGVVPPPAFEFHLWAVVGAFVLVRHGVRRLLTRISVHRGIWHSVPACATWGALTYLGYPSPSHALRLTMALAVALGYFSHLLLDEICSVNLANARVNRAFGTALKFWASSAWATLGVYVLLSYLTYLVVLRWPDDPYAFVPPAPPVVPYPLPQMFGMPAAGPWRRR